ncbi:hypothetical protein D6792_01530 [Candidatus Parcubacteria bacterium]|nr:MAG: hypothetical protein D6792_01530 [Candidatus Parcubacteria bacterium]
MKQNHQLLFIVKAYFTWKSKLEDYIIYNWDKTELGEKLDLIAEDGEIISQQFRTDIGNIDILTRDEKLEVMLL